MNDDDVVQVQVTCDDAAVLERIVERLLEDRLIACGQTTPPVTSRYWWQGARHADIESMCLLKTTAGALDRVVQAVLDEHPYETPEVIALPVTGGSSAYLEWVRATVTG